MITVKLIGGLGNQLFQIYTTIDYALTHGIPFRFPDFQQLGTGANDVVIRYTYWNSFLEQLKRYTIPILGVSKPFKYIHEAGFGFKALPAPTQTQDYTALIGYFQSYRYFDKNAERISRLIGINYKQQLVQQKCNDIDFSRTICMHFRVGDYKKYPHMYPILDYQYYHNSLHYICNNSNTDITTVLYSCEDDNIDDIACILDQLYVEFPLLTFKRVDTSFADWEQMLVFSLCKYIIIANSSFSWWGAYLNTMPNNIICYPSMWFKTEANLDASTMCPPQWIKIANC